MEPCLRVYGLNEHGSLIFAPFFLLCREDKYTPSFSPELKNSVNGTQIRQYFYLDPKDLTFTDTPSYNQSVYDPRRYLSLIGIPEYSKRGVLIGHDPWVRGGQVG